MRRIYILLKASWYMFIVEKLPGRCFAGNNALGSAISTSPTKRAFSFCLDTENKVRILRVARSRSKDRITLACDERSRESWEKGKKESRLPFM